jgi:hypothetical protein
VRKGIASRIAAAIRAIFGRVVACALIAVLAPRLTAALVSRLLSAKRAIAVIVLAVPIPLGALAYQAQHAWRAASGSFDRGNMKASVGSTGYGMEDFASFNKWKRGVEQTLKEAQSREQARQRDGGKAQASVDAKEVSIGPTHEVGAARIDSGIARALAERRAETPSANDEGEAIVGRAMRNANAANDANRANDTKESEPPVDSPSAAGLETRPTTAPGAGMSVPLAAVSPGLHWQPWRHGRGNVWGRGHRGGRHPGWAYYRLVGIARAFPYVLSIR